MPGGQPATAMLAVLFDAGARSPELRSVTGDRIAVYEPDARLSIVWTVDDECRGDRPQSDPPERVGEQFKHARDGWAVILFSGSPIWQVPIWVSRLGAWDWRVRARLQARTAATTTRQVGRRSRGGTPQGGSSASRVSSMTSLTRRARATHDPTLRLVPEPSRLHPVDTERS